MSKYVEPVWQKYIKTAAKKWAKPSPPTPYIINLDSALSNKETKDVLIVLNGIKIKVSKKVFINRIRRLYHEKLIIGRLDK